MSKKLNEIEYDQDRWDCFEKYDEDYSDYGELPRRAKIKKPIERVVEPVKGDFDE